MALPTRAHTHRRHTAATPRCARTRADATAGDALLRNLALAALVSCVAAPSAAQDSPAWGVAVTPRNFPEYTLEDVDEAYEIATELGDYSVFIVQWSQLDGAAVRLLVEKSRHVGLQPIVGLSPTTLDLGRKELDLPAGVRRRAGLWVSFANPIVRAEFMKAAVGLASLQPPYLCLATEINFLAVHRPDEYLHFVTLFKETKALIERISPRTRVFVSFQWELMRILDAREPHKIAEHRKLVDVFRPQLDLVGLTTYPAPFHETPADLVPDYFTWLAHHVVPSDEILLMEIGWPSRGTGSEAEQREFVRALPQLLDGVNVSVAAWALLHDVALEVFDDNLNSVGLVTIDGRRKPAFEAFQKLRATTRP